MKKKHYLSQQLFQELEKRIGRDYLGKRLRLQVKHTTVKFSDGRFNICWENVEPVSVILMFIL